ncbi:DUF4269 domain-containing protein [Novosphingobium mangrovi (ex Hu et al. 2023)]|uniref:DUF4269 domain-containing protein n=1 Tax=Novosphingobium mangrovi (ex Hu et al. 2023) TaxID=2930094 RepID=A0ABT0AEC0_9SPHN|nr:DUF4269 domain-containing protein [Novosphingobium mangrovi (ex Hu et al. 2023)]MCJ1961538.1 DUF4269 domain-containing protein [Novosphingobium mangrovi (ex Hu et al. 2023)]
MDWRGILASSGLPDALAAYDARVVGTFPLGLDVAGSDVDIVCHAPDGHAFAQELWERFAGCDHFALRQWVQGERAVIAQFLICDLPFEVFGAPVPVVMQAGWRHFEVERRLLALSSGAFHAAVRELRRSGIKTEPAFAQVLGLAGDPYAQLFDLALVPDAQLRGILAQAGFA